MKNIITANRLSDDICRFVSHEFFGINEVDVLKNMWSFHIIQNIAGLDYFRDALVTYLYPSKTNKGFIWAKNSAKRSSINIIFGMLLNSFSRIGITVWKKFEKDLIISIQIINF